ncbi:MAG: LamG-like jellyroll fold domain-containing protein, partial [Candidatus Thorarchaeota archaeon]
MRRSSVLTLVMITLFVLSLASPYDLDTATDTSLVDRSMSELGLLSEGETTYTGVGSALPVAFSGTFVNASPFISMSSTLSNLLTPGVSYAIDNASTATWTANVLVSPPVNVTTLNFSVTYPVTDWKVVSVTDPVGVLRTNPSEWYQDYDEIVVPAVDPYGVWKLTFTAANHLDDLSMGPSGGPYTSATTTFDTDDTARFGVTSSWITGATAEFDLLDPTGSVWYSSSDSESGSTTHALPSFRNRKDLTIHNAYVIGDLTDFPVLIDIIDTDLHTDVQADGDDIVFYSNGVVLSHEIELFEQDYSGSEAHLVAWVKANLSSSVDTTISMYYGNPIVGPQSHPEDVWTSDYSAVWHLGEDATAGQTSTDHLDSTGNGYYGDQFENSDITGIFGDGQNFDGNNDVVNVASERGLEPSGDVSLSGWFKLDSGINQNVGTTQVLLTKAIDGDTDMHVLIAGSDYTRTDIQRGSLVFKMENSGLGQMYVWSLQKSWAAGTWYFFTCTITASTPELNKVFIDGVDNTNTTTGSLSTASLDFTDDWVIGGGFVDQMSPKEGWFDGVIDEVRVVNTIHSSAWIRTEWVMLDSSSTFRTVGSESVQNSPDMYIEKVLDNSAPAGLWTISAHYNDSGSTVSHRVGEYSRNFIVRRDSTLAIDSPSDAAAGLESLMV